ncbi:penicillin-binding protein [Anoxybacterium hadale]|uniref:Penicillin-binding protein n=1 Tax=Anoxybacterium hadale TaxID=3408580 RepID=A0ACD1A6Q8_9FIRM|nr:penicillin-binding protein [Clostridiales bacterium]
MKILTKRAFGLLLLVLILLLGLTVFTFRYVKDARTWAQYPTNKHLFQNGQLLSTGEIRDRNDEILYKAENGVQRFHSSETIRKALMHTTGDSYGNVATSVQVAFGDKLSGWGPVNGAYRFNDSSFGSNLKLTLDAELCAEAYQALKGRKGTVGVYNYKTGELLCMVSSPTFDPENHPDVAANPEKYEGVYLNRLISAAYTPGSVFKLVTAAAAIDKLPDYSNRVFHCEGEKLIDGDKVTCPSPHGDVTLTQALAVSCNIAFAEISLELGGDTLQNYAEKAGFNGNLEIDGIKAAKGKINTAGAKGGDLAWAGIGQYNDTANPLTFMAYMGSIANQGIRVSPRLIDKNSGILKLLPDLGPEKKRILNKATADTLKAMMRNNVTEEYGEKNYKGLELCAKSGTAQVGGDKAPHSWFAGFMDRQDCPLAFVVVVENGGAGSKVAGAVAAKVLKAAAERMVSDNTQ